MLRVHKNLDTLTSRAMHGRGAAFGGDSIAAAYIASQFAALNLQMFSGNSYFQKFHYSINTFPGELELKLGKQKLVCGTDYILAPDAKTVNGNFKIVHVDSSILANPVKFSKLVKKSTDGSCLIISENLFKEFNTDRELRFWLNSFPVIVKLIDHKLTGNLSTRQSLQSNIWMKKSVWNLHKDKASRLYVNLEATFLQEHLSQNVVGMIEGSAKPDSFLVISAHYDHLGSMGKKVFFPGANDNASGVSMLLELADYFSRPENRLPYSLVFIAFGGEESGLLGSRYFVENPLFGLSNVKFVLNLDLVGTGSEGITVVNGSVFESDFERLNSLNKQGQYFKEVKKRGKAPNSDHYPFSEKGVPAFFIYTMGGIQAYHDVDDVAATLPLTKYKELFELITKFEKGF